MGIIEGSSPPLALPIAGCPTGTSPMGCGARAPCAPHGVTATVPAQLHTSELLSGAKNHPKAKYAPKYHSDRLTRPLQLPRGFLQLLTCLWALSRGVPVRAPGWRGEGADDAGCWCEAGEHLLYTLKVLLCLASQPELLLFAPSLQGNRIGQSGAKMISDAIRTNSPDCVVDV